MSDDKTNLEQLADRLAVALSPGSTEVVDRNISYEFASCTIATPDAHATVYINGSTLRYESYLGSHNYQRAAIDELLRHFQGSPHRSLRVLIGPNASDVMADPELTMFKAAQPDRSAPHGRLYIFEKE